MRSEELKAERRKRHGRAARGAEGGACRGARAAEAELRTDLDAELEAQQNEVVVVPTVARREHNPSIQ